MKKKNIISWLLSIIMLAAFVPETIHADDIKEIGSYEELLKIGNDDTYPLSGSYKLTADIVLPPADKSSTEYSNWTPIGISESAPFTGTFDGGGHSVSKIEIGSSQRVGNKGFFGCIKNAAIKNIKIDGEILLTGSNCPNIAVIAGLMQESAILNCYAAGSVRGTYYTGGIAGQTKGSNTIANSCFVGNVAGTGRGPGGIVSSHADNVVINNCYAVTSFANSASSVNGVIAGNSATGKTGTIRAYGETAEGVNICAPLNSSALSAFVYDVTELTKEQMQSESFTQTLNANITSYGTEEWSGWTYKENDYPIQRVFTESGEEPTVTPTPIPVVTPTPTITPTSTPSVTPTTTPSVTPTPAPEFTAKPTPTPIVTPVPTSNPQQERSAYKAINFIDYNEYYTDAGAGTVPEINAGGIMTRSRGNKQYVRFDSVDFGETGSYAAEIYARLTAYSNNPDYTLDICIDTTDNVIGTLRYGDTYTASGRNYAVELNQKVTGVHTLYLKWTDALIGFYAKFAEGTINLSANGGKIEGNFAQMRVSENTFIHEDSYGDGGYCVQGIGKYGMCDSVSFPAVDFGEEGVSETVTVRAARSNAMCVEGESTGEVPPAIRVRLGGRGGEIIGETELLPSNPDNLGIWKTYTMQLPKTISGIHTVTLEINYETKVHYIAFDYTEPQEPETESEKLNGHSVIFAEKAKVGERSTFYGTGGKFMPKYLTASGDVVFDNVELDNAEYIAAYVRQGAGGVFSVFMDDEETPLTEISASCWSFETVTVPLGTTVSGTHKFTLRLKDGQRRVPDLGWIRFLTAEEYSEFTGREKIAAVGELAERTGYLTYLSQQLDSSKYQAKGFYTSGTLSAFDTSAAISYAPDTALLMFGGAEARSAAYGGFEEKYQQFIDDLKSANPNVKIYIQTPSPMQKDNSGYDEVLEILNRLSAANDAKLIDICREMQNYGYPMEYLVPDASRATLSPTGARLVSKLTYNALFNETTETGDKYMLPYDTDLIDSSTGAVCTIGTFRNVTEQHIKAADGGKTIIMIKNADLNRVNSMTVTAASRLVTAGVLPIIECRIDSIDGEIIGRTVVFSTAQNTEYAFLPITNSTVPVTDGQRHNLFFVLDKGADASGSDVVNIKSIELHRGDASPVVLKNGVIQDRNYAINLADSSKNDVQYTGGETYTWITSAADSEKDARFIIALYNKDGCPVTVGASDTTKGRLSVSMTLPEDFTDGEYSIKGYIWQDGAVLMKPLRDKLEVLPEEKIKIGLIGDSTTNNVTVNGITYENICYPNFLRSMMDTDKYEIMNFGRGTATTGSYISGHRIWFEYAMSKMCDAYFIMLGTNNAKGVELSEFENNYQTIIDGLREARQDCRIYIMTPIPAQKDKYMIEEKTLTDVIIPMVKNVADKNGLPLIDIYSELKNNERFGSMYGSDGIHENEEGMIAVANAVKSIIVRDFPQ